MPEILKPGARGLAVSELQNQLYKAGYAIEATAIYDDATETAVAALQRARGLVVDGITGPKTRAALAGMNTGKLLREADLMQAAERLALPLATVKAVNAVESNGEGFFPDGRACILFERHVFYRRLKMHDIDPEPLVDRYPGVVNPKTGGYAGNAAEYARLATAIQINRPAALESASWGLFQIMGYHWESLGYDDIEAFVQANQHSEAEQLDAFVRFIIANPELHKALAAKKWTAFSRGYNGPDYIKNLHDVKLAREFARFSDTTDKVAS